MQKVSANQINFLDLRTDSGYIYQKAVHLTGEQVHDEYAWRLWVPRELVLKYFLVLLIVRCLLMGYTRPYRELDVTISGLDSTIFSKYVFTSTSKEDGCRS